MDFGFTFIDSPLIISLLAVSLAVTLFLATVYAGRIRRIRRYRRLHANDEIAADLPPISIVVYCKDSSEALERMLPKVLAQDYPSRFEVIVATDGRSSRAEDVVTLLSGNHSNLRMTYVPDEAHALSRKKLAVTLGIKAARHPYILLTDANAMPMSERWLARMASYFTLGKEVVIGTSHTRAESFGVLADKVIWLSSAIGGHPYRGDETNLAFARHLFFDNKGFADSVGFHYGIDDIFLSRIASVENTAVELSPETNLEYSAGNLREHHLNDKLQHLFTGRKVRRASRLFFGFGSLLLWGWVYLTVALAVVSFPAALPPLASLFMGIVAIVTISIAWSGASKSLQQRIKVQWLPLLIFRHPFSTLIYKFRARALRSKNFTWSKPY